MPSNGSFSRTTITEPVTLSPTCLKRLGALDEERWAAKPKPLPFDSWPLIWLFITAEFEGCFCGKTQRILRYKHATHISKSISKTYGRYGGRTRHCKQVGFALAGYFGHTSVGCDNPFLCDGCVSRAANESHASSVITAYVS